MSRSTSTIGLVCLVVSLGCFGDCDDDPLEQQNLANMTPAEVVAQVGSTFNIELRMTAGPNPTQWTVHHRVDDSAVIGAVSVEPEDPSLGFDTETAVDGGVLQIDATSQAHFTMIYRCLSAGSAALTIEAMAKGDPSPKQHTVQVTCEGDSPVESWDPSGGLTALGQMIAGEPNLFCAVLRDDPDNGPVTHSDGVQVKDQAVTAVGILGFVQTVLLLDKSAADRIETARTDLVIRPSSTARLDATEVVVLAMDMHDTIALSSGSDIFQYGFVFDADDIPANNYLASPSFPMDFFDDTDQWYVAAYDPSTGWELQVTDARDGGFVDLTDSRARILVAGTAMALLVPIDEFEAEVLPYRLTAFRHTGDFGIGSGNWDGDVEPPVDVGLHDLDLGAR